MSHWLVYWVLMLDNISMSIDVIWVLTLVFVPIFLIVISILINDDYRTRSENTINGLRKIRNKTLKWCAIIFSIFFIIVTFLPGTKQMAAIYLLPKIAANKNIQQLSPKLVKLATLYLDKQLNELGNKPPTSSTNY